MNRRDDLPPGASVGWVLIFGLLFWGGMAYAALAQGYPSAYSIPPGAKRFEPHPATAACAARIAVIDRAGAYNRDTTVSIPVGAVVFRYTTHGPQGHADTAEVMDMDAGLSVAPLFSDVVPDAPVFFCIRKAKGAS